MRRTSMDCRWILLVFFLAASSGPPVALGQTATHRDEAALREDLRSVIVLAGYPCHEIESSSHPHPSEYHVSCDADRHYRVVISEEQGIHVVSTSHPRVSAEETDHDAFVRRQLFAIVNLAGHRCASVVSFERRDARDNLVTCEDQTTYRIHVTREGRLMVDKHRVEK